ncbi:MAG: hypothetical protein QG629_654 [Patescibacteria group bacterium]|nr:hypothetical protein [Candidatus Saccharibacteria bacterium]MDQ5963572.1 hypothetical protein [Patescibacteria group bacterium]
MTHQTILVHELAATPDAPLAVFYDTSELTPTTSTLLSPACEKLAELTCAFALIGEPDKPIVVDYENGGIQVALTEPFDDLRQRTLQRLNPNYAQKVTAERHPSLDEDSVRQLAESVLAIASAGVHSGERSSLHSDSELATGMIERYMQINTSSQERPTLSRTTSARLQAAA